MRYLGLRHCLAGCALAIAATSHATVYTITSTEDVGMKPVVRDDSKGSVTYDVKPQVKDGECSLREAIYASTYQVAVDGCEAGSRSNQIRLEEDKTYRLTAGNLPVGALFQVDDDNDVSTPPVDRYVTAQITIQLSLDAFEDPDGKVFPVITSANDSRVFNIEQGSVLTISNTTLMNGTVPGNGGLVRSRGSLILEEGVTMKAGKAANGGAIYLDESALLSFEEGTRFENNTATNQGSVIGTSGQFAGAISGYRFYMAGNQAQGGDSAGTIYLDGPSDKVVALVLTNGVMTNNKGGAVTVRADKHVSALTNMTIAFNDGVGLFIDESVFDSGAGETPDTTDQILHTAIIGNSASCGGSALDPASSDDADARLWYVITDAGTQCPASQELAKVTDDSNGANPDVLLGEDRQPCNGIGASGCSPMLAKDLGGMFPGYLPNPTPSGLDPAYPSQTASLVDRANPENVSTDLCDAEDYRGEARGGAGGRCDVGAVEFFKALAVPDEIDLISGQEVLADVLENDRNDTLVDCNNVPADTECLQVIVNPERGSAQVVYETLADGRRYPRILYTPASNFHGVDQLRYEVSRHAFLGGTDLGQDQTEIANFVAEPPSGLVESKSIGAGSVAGLLGMLILGVWRRKKLLLSGLFLLISSPAFSAEIIVDSLEDNDPFIKGDGECTLREALANAASGAASADCAYGASGEDEILLPAGTIQLSSSLLVEGSSVIIEGKGARDEAGDGEKTLTRILGNGSERLFEVQAPNSSGYPAVAFRYMSLENGVAPDNDEVDAGQGGAVSTGGSVVFDHVRLLNNQADVDGGVIHVRANAGNNKSLTLNHVFASGNVSGGAGGVISTEASPGELFKILIQDSTFANNSAGTEGGVLDANQPSGSVDIVNSTFLGNSAATGGALDLSGTPVVVDIMNSTFRDNGSNGIEMGTAEVEVSLFNSILFASGDGPDTSVMPDATILKSSAYNAFSGTQWEAEDATENAATNAEAVDVAALDDSLSEAQGTAEDYYPPYLAIANPTPGDGLLDAGNPEELQAGTASPARCRATDLRGIARTSGGECDRGAYEYQQITAEDDKGANISTPDRRVAVDILKNDLPSDGAEIEYLDPMDPSIFKTGVFTIEHGELVVADDDSEEVINTHEEYVQDPGHPTRFILDSSDSAINGAMVEFVWRYYSEATEGYDVTCGAPLPQDFIDANPDDYSDGDVAEDCVILYSPANEGFIPSEDDPTVDAVCNKDKEGNGIPEWEAPKIAILYGFTDSEGEFIPSGEEASVIMTFQNKAPKLEGQSRLNKPGATVVFELEATDPDGNPIQWNTLVIKREPNFAKRDADGEVLNTGLILDRVNGRVTYIPQGNFTTFKDAFSLAVSDDCGGESQAATFTINYANQETSAGSGSLGWMLLGSLGLLLCRRRTAAQ